MRLVSYSQWSAYGVWTFLGRRDVGTFSVVALQLLIGWPILVQLLLLVDCAYFPTQHHAVNALIGYGVWLQAQAWLVFVICDLGLGGLGYVRFWERILRKAWLLVAVIGGLLAGSVVLLGSFCGWKSVIEDDIVAEVHFVAIVYTAVATGLWALSGGLYLLAKVLLRRGSGALSTLAYIFSVVIMLSSVAMSLLMFREAVGWGMVSAQ